MAIWQFESAQANFSDLIDCASQEGPQSIVKNGVAVAVVISTDNYLALTSNTSDFKRWLFSGPKVADYAFERDVDGGREVDL
jgi:antitoxin Phd